MTSKPAHKYSTIVAAIIALVTAALNSACDSVIYDDLDPCEVKLRFVYDYNMEFANAFPSQVDHLTVLIFDSANRLVALREEANRDSLASETWRMTVAPAPGSAPLAPGSYTVYAYGGMGADRSFDFTSAPAPGMDAATLGVDMQAALIGADPGKRLHPLFYGTGTFEVKQDDSTPGRTYTIKMMRDTHNIRILLQHLSGEPVESADYSFALTRAANSSFDSANLLRPVEPFTIHPWTKGNTVPSAPDMPQLAFAEFSTSRLTPAADMRLVINHKSGSPDNPTVSIPLVPYLLLMKSEVYATMANQEYLDRESEWSVIFFLDSNDNWVRTHIIVNNWVVRLNQADL